jgi:hypothetical protein
MSNLDEIKKIIIKNAMYYEAPMNEVRLDMFARDLLSLSPEQVSKAFEVLRGQPNRFRLPMPAEIKAVYNPVIDEKNQAREIASRITKAIQKFGYPDPSGARGYIGEVGWDAVMSRGGWGYICENLGVTIDVGTFTAQVRDAVESRIKSQPMASGGVALNPGQEQKYLDKK